MGSARPAAVNLCVVLNTAFIIRSHAPDSKTSDNLKGRGLYLVMSINCIICMKCARLTYGTFKSRQQNGAFDTECLNVSEFRCSVLLHLVVE